MNKLAAISAESRLANHRPVIGEYVNFDNLAAQEATVPMECGHPRIMMLKSAETEEDLYCSVCDLASSKNDRISDLETQLLAYRDSGALSALRDAKDFIENQQL